MPDKVWVLWENASGGELRLIGIYSSREVAEADAAKSERWWAEEWPLDHEAVA